MTSRKAPSADLKASLVAAIPNMRAFAISLCGDVDRADDLVQEALVKAWNGINSFAEGSNLKAWLFTILRNAYFSELRKRKREVSDSDGELTAQLSVPPEQQGHVDLADLRTALSTLPSDQREALVLVGAEGFSYEEAAEITGCALGTIKSCVSRGRARLSEVMGFETGKLDHRAVHRHPKRVRGMMDAWDMQEHRPADRRLRWSIAKQLTP